LYSRINRRLELLEEKLGSCLLCPRLALCQKMQQKLPRELRDIVYEQLLETRIWPVDGKTLEELKIRSYTPMHGSVVVQTQPYIPMHAFSKMRYLADKDCVGIATKQELAESYYRLTTFVFGGDAAVCHRLESFLYAVDPWHSLTRVGSFVQNIELQSTDTGLEDGSRIFDELMMLQQATVFDDALVLQQAARNYRITIVVEKHQHYKTADIPRLVGLVGKILPLLDQLMSKGHTISVEIHPRFAQYLCRETLEWVKSKGEPQVKISGRGLDLNVLEQLLRAASSTEFFYF
jgi:hypothetical protein